MGSPFSANHVLALLEHRDRVGGVVEFVDEATGDVAVEIRGVKDAMDAIISGAIDHAETYTVRHRPEDNREEMV